MSRRGPSILSLFFDLLVVVGSTILVYDTLAYFFGRMLP